VAALQGALVARLAVTFGPWGERASMQIPDAERSSPRRKPQHCWASPSPGSTVMPA